MKVGRIRINGMENPMGYDLSPIRISWMVSETDAARAVNTKIEVSREADFAGIVYKKEGADLDQAGETLDLQLQPRTRYYVRVTVTADNGETAISGGTGANPGTATGGKVVMGGEAITVGGAATDGEAATDSEPAYFETGKMDEPWSGRWIGPQPGDTYHPVFIKTFHVKIADKLSAGVRPKANAEAVSDDTVVSGSAVRSARLYISGLGLYSADLNGGPVGDEILTPYYSDYHTEVQYQTFDITSQVKTDNVIRITLGNGWYKGKFGLARQENNFGSTFMLLAEIRIRYTDGTEDVIGTDDTWLYQGSDIESSSIYDGEVINHLLYAGKDNPLKTPIFTEPEGRLVERYAVPIREQEDMPVREVIHTPAGETVLDFGQNFAGYVTFRTFIPKGQKIILDFGEILQDNNFYNANYRDAKSQFVYISDGREETVKPHFTYFGFRYCRVTGWQGEIRADDFMGKAIYSSMRRTGMIETGNAKVNRLFLNALWGQKSNFMDLATDCPQRDERLGWTGDAQVFSGTASYNMDTAAFYDGFIHDMRTEQKKYDGVLPGVIPVLDPAGPIFSSIWGDIATFLPTVIYEHFGDKAALRKYYPMMKDWVDKITREDQKRGQQYLFNFSNQLGDWLALDGRTEQSFSGATDEYYIGSCYYAESVKKTADAAHVLGLGDDEKYYRDLHEKIRGAIIHEYYTPTGRLAIDTQTGYIVALYTNTYPDKQRVVDGLRTRLYKDCYKIKGGFCGAPIMCRVMAENGLQEEAMYFLLQNDYPGWLHCVDLGATTIWERWNSVLDDGHLSGTTMNSLNHYAFGSVVEFLYRDVCGLKALEPGFRRVEFSPLVNQKLHHASLTYDSVYGRYETGWEIEKDGQVHVTLRVPFGCTAVVGLPFYPDGKNIGEVGSGVHSWTYRPTEDLRSRYTRHTLFNEMMKDPKAMEIIDRVSPLLGGLLGTGNRDFYYDSLDTIMGMSYMGFRKEEVEKLAEEICSIYDD